MNKHIKHIFSNLQQDLPAGISVFLIAVPLSLGIALASGAPLFSGLITGIIAGLLVAPLSGSALGISGAAAGLAVVVLAEIGQLGFSAFLLAVVLTGLIQFGMGLFRAGVVAYYFPSSVVNGMMSGIGVILLLKQIPHAVGYDRDYEGDFSFFQADNFSSLSELSHMLDFTNPTAIAIAIAAVSLAILMLWEWQSGKGNAFFRQPFGVVLAVLAGVFINQALGAYAPDWVLQQSHLVELPVLGNLADFAGQLHFPDFAALANYKVYLAALALAVVASLETLLAVEAVDKQDPYKRKTPANQELMAQGVGNICCGMIGGLPLAQVIVRSSLNVQSGARTKLSAIIHGLLLLVAVIAVPAWLNLIPLASLAAILLLVGFKLANPNNALTFYKAGWYHFVPFMATVLGLVFTNLLVGVAIGLFTALFAILFENYKSAAYFQ